MAKRTRERERIEELEARLRVRGKLLPGRDNTGLLAALEITIGMIPDPAEKYRWALGPDGQSIIASLFQATTLTNSVDRIIPTDMAETAEQKYRDWIG